MTPPDPIQVIETPTSARIILPRRPRSFRVSAARFAVRFALAQILIAAMFIIPVLLSYGDMKHAPPTPRPRGSTGSTLLLYLLPSLLVLELMMVIVLLAARSYVRPTQSAEIVIDNGFIRRHAWGPLDLFRIPVSRIRALAIAPTEMIGRPRRSDRPGTFFVRIVAGQRSVFVAGNLRYERATQFAAVLSQQLHRLAPGLSPDDIPIHDATQIAALEPIALLRHCGVSVEITRTGLQLNIPSFFRLSTGRAAMTAFLAVEPTPPWLGAVFILVMAIAATQCSHPGLLGTIAAVVALTALAAMLLWCILLFIGQARYRLEQGKFSKTLQLSTRPFWRSRPCMAPFTITQRPRPLSRGRLHQLFLTTPSHQKIYLATGTPAACNALAHLLRTALPHAPP